MGLSSQMSLSGTASPQPKSIRPRGTSGRCPRDLPVVRAAYGEGCHVQL